MSGENKKNHLSSGLCGEGENAKCQSCIIEGKLHCRPNKKQTYFYWLNLIPTIFTGVFGLILASIIVLEIMWPVIITGLAAFIFWGLGLETKLLCSRCPYYGSSQNKISCWALRGYPRLWEYVSRPLSRGERFLLRFIYALIVIVGAGTMLRAVLYMIRNMETFGSIAIMGQSGVLIAFILSGINLLNVKKKVFCSKCANFYCALNSVPDEVKEDFATVHKPREGSSKK